MTKEELDAAVDRRLAEREEEERSAATAFAFRIGLLALIAFALVSAATTLWPTTFWFLLPW